MPAYRLPFTAYVHINKPAHVGAQVIPPQRRSLAYSLDLAISGIINAATMPLAGMVIEHYGGHAAVRVSDDDASDAPAPAAAPADNLSNARAIEDGLLLLIMLSFGVKLFVRTPMPISPECISCMLLFI